MVVFNANMHLMVINLAMEAKDPLKSTPFTWEYPFATNLCLISNNFTQWIFCGAEYPFASYTLAIFWNLGQSHVSLAMSELYSSCIAASHLLEYLDLNASLTFKGSSNNATLVRSSPCWSKIWFFHHYLGGHCSLLEYLPSLPNLSIQPSFSAWNLIATSFATKWSPTYSSHLLLLSQEDDLKDSYITTTIRPLFLLLRRIHKAFSKLVPPSMNTTSLFFYVFFSF